MSQKAKPKPIHVYEAFKKLRVEPGAEIWLNWSGYRMKLISLTEKTVLSGTSFDALVRSRRSPGFALAEIVQKDGIQITECLGTHRVHRKGSLGDVLAHVVELYPL